MEMSRKKPGRCFPVREATSRDGNMNVNVISRDMIIKILGWVRSSRKPCKKADRRTDMVPWEHQVEEPEKGTRETIKDVGRERRDPFSGRLAMIMASSLSSMILYVHFHISFLPASFTRI